MSTPTQTCPRKYFSDRQKVRMQTGFVTFNQLTGTGVFDNYYIAQFRRPFVLAALGVPQPIGDPTGITGGSWTLETPTAMNEAAQMLYELFFSLCLANAQDYLDSDGNQQYNGNTLYPAIDNSGNPVNKPFQRYMQQYIGDYDNDGGQWTGNFYELMQPMNDEFLFWQEIFPNIATQPDVFQRFIKFQRSQFENNSAKLFAPPGYYLLKNPSGGNTDPYATALAAYIATLGSPASFSVVTTEIDADTGAGIYPGSDSLSWVTPR